jgi:hypothetical protein
VGERQDGYRDVFGLHVENSTKQANVDVLSAIG